MGKVTLPHRNGDFMANVYIEEYPIDNGIISDKYYSSILYIDNEYYALQNDKLYKLNFII